eukprot:jgi/Botrbrau1/12323/Bobra.0205s0021.1
MDSLPHDILIRILSYLPARDACSASWVCKAWRDKLVQDNKLWEQLREQTWPNLQKQRGQGNGQGSGSGDSRMDVIERAHNLLWRDCPVKAKRLLYSASHGLQRLWRSAGHPPLLLNPPWVVLTDTSQPQACVLVLNLRSTPSSQGLEMWSQWAGNVAYRLRRPYHAVHGVQAAAGLDGCIGSPREEHCLTAMTFPFVVQAWGVSVCVWHVDQPSPLALEKDALSGQAMAIASESNPTWDEGLVLPSSEMCFAAATSSTVRMWAIHDVDTASEGSSSYVTSLAWEGSVGDENQIISLALWSNDQTWVPPSGSSLYRPVHLAVGTSSGVEVILLGGPRDNPTGRTAIGSFKMDMQAPARQICVSWTPFPKPAAAAVNSATGLNGTEPGIKSLRGNDLLPPSSFSVEGNPWRMHVLLGPAEGPCPRESREAGTTVQSSANVLPGTAEDIDILGRACKRLWMGTGKTSGGLPSRPPRFTSNTTGLSGGPPLVPEIKLVPGGASCGSLSYSGPDAQKISCSHNAAQGELPDWSPGPAESSEGKFNHGGEQTINTGPGPTSEVHKAPPAVQALTTSLSDVESRSHSLGKSLCKSSVTEFRTSSVICLIPRRDQAVVSDEAQNSADADYLLPVQHEVQHTRDAAADLPVAGICTGCSEPIVRESLCRTAGPSAAGVGSSTGGTARKAAGSDRRAARSEGIFEVAWTCPAPGAVHMHVNDDLVALACDNAALLLLDATTGRFTRRVPNRMVDQLVTGHLVPDCEVAHCQVWVGDLGSGDPCAHLLSLTEVGAEQGLGGHTPHYSYEMALTLHYPSEKKVMCRCEVEAVVRTMKPQRFLRPRQRRSADFSEGPLEVFQQPLYMSRTAFVCKGRRGKVCDFREYFD